MFKKLSKKNTQDTAVIVGAAVVGAAVSDGVVGLVPEQYKKWGKPAFALATAIAAAATKSSTSTEKAVQSALIGMSIKQGLDALRELVLSKIPTQDAQTEIGKFSNRVLGLAAGDAPIYVPQIVNAGNTGRFKQEDAMLVIWMD